MPAMRILASTLLLISVLGSGLSWAGDAAGLKKPSTQATDNLGPLAPPTEQLDDFFVRLKRERNPGSANAIAEQIRDMMAQSGSPTVDMLMANATKAVGDKKYGLALDLLDQVTLLKPDFAEGWNRRAMVHYMMGNLAKAMSDTAHVLTLEPRHLGALNELATIMHETGRDAQALQALETYLNFYPADRDAQKQAMSLINTLSGQKI